MNFGESSFGEVGFCEIPAKRAKVALVATVNEVARYRRAATPVELPRFRAQVKTSPDR